MRKFHRKCATISCASVFLKTATVTAYHKVLQRFVVHPLVTTMSILQQLPVPGSPSAGQSANGNIEMERWRCMKMKMYEDMKMLILRIGKWYSQGDESTNYKCKETSEFVPRGPAKEYLPAWSLPDSNAVVHCAFHDKIYTKQKDTRNKHKKQKYDDKNKTRQWRLLEQDKSFVRHHGWATR